MLQEVAVRNARPDDVKTILGLIRALATYERLSDTLVCREDALHQALFGTLPALYALLAFQGRQAVGLATYYFAFSTFQGRKLLYLEDIVVTEQTRGAGVGRLLMAAAAQHAHASGCAGMRWMALDWNTSAIGFYESLGAVADSQWRPYSLAGDAFEALVQHPSRAMVRNE